LDTGPSLCDWEVDDLGPKEPPPSAAHANALQHNQLESLFEDPGSAAPRVPVREARAHQLHGAPSTYKAGDQQHSSEEPDRQSRGLPPAKAAPAAPPAPRRRRPAPTPTLRYIHAADRGFPILPLPKQPPEGEEPAGRAAARWVAWNHPKNTALYCRRGEDKAKAIDVNKNLNLHPHVLDLYIDSTNQLSYAHLYLYMQT
jgi:hypothetical protein